MTRSHITVRPAQERDLAHLVQLWGELRRCGALHPRLAVVTDDDKIAERVRRLLTRSDCRVLLAALDGAPAGMAVLTTSYLEAFGTSRCVQIEYTVVAEEFRRRGIGRALLGAASAYAEEIGAEHITATVGPMSREANRFYARLGFTPLVVRRMAPVSALRRRLATIDVSSGREQVLRRRPVTGRPGVRAALRRIAIAPTVAAEQRDA